MAKCPICSAVHSSCGPSAVVTPVDHVVKRLESGSMALKEYEVTVAGRSAHKTTMLLNEADAKKIGAVEVKAASAPANKAKSVTNKQKTK